MVLKFQFLVLDFGGVQVRVNTACEHSESGERLSVTVCCQRLVWRLRSDAGSLSQSLARAPDVIMPVISMMI
eukprot:1557490-Rhodomonas_salina.1